MSAIILSDFPDGGSAISCPISPSRECPSSFSVEGGRAVTRADIVAALRSGSRHKNFATQILRFCEILPDDLKEISREQREELFKLAARCRSTRSVRSALRSGGGSPEQDVKIDGEENLLWVMRNRTFSPLQTALARVLLKGSRAVNFTDQIRRLCLSVPDNVQDVDGWDIKAALSLGAKCRATTGIAKLLRYKSPKKIKADLRKDAAIIRKERLRLKRIEGARRLKIREALRRRMHQVLKRNRKSDHTVALLGCSVRYLIAHLEQQWQPGMSWANYGISGWHIDHIRPCASFDLSDPDEQRKCFHFTNLQPLWAKENIIKGAKYNPENQKETL